MPESDVTAGSVLNDVQRMMMEDALAPAGVSDDQLSEVRELAEKQIYWERKALFYEQEMNSAAAQAHQIRTKLLPERMAALRLSSFTLIDGSAVDVSRQYFASIPTEEHIEKERDPDKRAQLEQRRRDAFAWLRQSGNGDLIKNQIKASLGKGEDAVAASVVKTLIDLGVDFKQAESVHPATLKSFVKEQISNGVSGFRGELLGAFALDVAKITPRKK